MTIANTGVTGLTAGTGISLSGSTGNVTITNTAATTNQLVNGSYTLTLNADGSTSFPTYTFPDEDGANGQILIADGTGNVTWQNPPVGNTLINGSYSVTLNSDGSLQSSPGSFVLRCDDIAGADSRITMNGNQTIIKANTTGVGITPTASVTTDGSLGIVDINTNNGGTVNNNWTFNADGTATFPASTASGNPARIQSTAANF